MNWSGGSRVESASGFLPVDRDIKQISIPRDNNDRTVSSARLLPRIPRNARNSAPCVAHAADAERPRGYADILTRSRARPISPRLSNLLDSPRGWGEGAGGGERGRGTNGESAFGSRAGAFAVFAPAGAGGRGQGVGGRGRGRGRDSRRSFASGSSKGRPRPNGAAAPLENSEQSVDFPCPPTSESCPPPAPRQPPPGKGTD